MKCPKCQVENREGARFCIDCGNKLVLDCPECGKTFTAGTKFCDECGHDLKTPKEYPPVVDSEPIPPLDDKAPRTPPTEFDGERKHITALFSDMAGYTDMSERLDPEEVKEITTRIFSEISRIVDKYNGFIEKFIGDAVMAIFGIPLAHEDDPVRAIRAAKEIHDVVRAISPELEPRIGKPLFMHTGINTGLVVTGEVDLEKGTHGLAGDTINVAARLSSLAKAGEIVVGPDTFRHAEGHFGFEALEPTTLKGKSEPIQAYKVVSRTEQPGTTRRHHGLRADLIGREVELAQLEESAERLRQGKGSIISICGDTGVGKSRLLEEFKATLDLKETRWLYGQAYAYSQNMPYFPLTDLLNRAFQIKEDDPRETVRTKVESGTESLVGERRDIIPYVGSLFSLTYPEVEKVSPEFWKSRLQEAIQVILAKLAQGAPTVICLEDLHWGDPSFINLFRLILSEFRYPVLFLCSYMPTFSLFTSYEVSGVGLEFEEITLHDLSPSEVQVMVESLLKTKDIPKDLRRFLLENVGGNPFYLEEVTQALIESGVLARDDGAWRVSRPISHSDMPSTIQGIISARLDRLEKEAKRVLQEASVIGRAFLYEILKKCTNLQEQFDAHLTRLERMDLIHARTLQPYLEYIFKSALTQEVVYNGLLKKERQVIHERIALVMEQLFRDRIPEFYETLAYHFKQGHSTLKAVHYLMKAGEKSLGRYSVEESHQYFKEAFDLLNEKPDRTKDEDGLLIDLLIKWSLVYYYLGDFRGLVGLLHAHKDLADSEDDIARLGMFYAWFGFSLYPLERYEESYEYLLKALHLGEKTGDQKLTGYACSWLSWTCTDMGLIDEAIRFGEKAQEIARIIPSDQYLFFKSLGGIGYASSCRGDRKRAVESGSAILQYGQTHSNLRSMVLGQWVLGFNSFCDGDLPAAIAYNEKAIQISEDPFYSQFPRLMLGMGYALNGQIDEAEAHLREVVSFGKRFGCENLGTPAHCGLGLVLMAGGRMAEGLKMAEEATQRCLENHRKTFYATSQCVLGEVYLQIVQKRAPVSLATMAKNIGFILKNVPSAVKKAEEHFHAAIEVAGGIGAKGIQGQAYLGLGGLYEAKGRPDQARDCFTAAVQFLEECQSEVLLKQARQALADLV
jgi:class 3 adenylate cyclase/tetratricopeptide (TPR) repeat protein